MTDYETLEQRIRDAERLAHIRQVSSDISSFMFGLLAFCSGIFFVLHPSTFDQTSVVRTLNDWSYLWASTWTIGGGVLMISTFTRPYLRIVATFFLTIALSLHFISIIEAFGRIGIAVAVVILTLIISGLSTMVIAAIAWSRK
jgi:hypothetical protein